MRWFCMFDCGNYLVVTFLSLQDTLVNSMPPPITDCIEIRSAISGTIGFIGSDIFHSLSVVELQREQFTHTSSVHRFEISL